MGYKQLSSDQIEFIIKNYQTMNYKQISEALGISKSKVVAQALNLKEQGLLTEKVKRYNWSYEEEQKLLTLLNLNVEEISKVLNKDINKVVSKIKQLRRKGIIKEYKINYKKDIANNNTEITEWTNKDIENLLYNIKNMGLEKLAKTLNKGTFDIIMKYYELKDIYDIQTYWNCKDYTDWNKETDLYLIENFSTKLREDIIDTLQINDWKKITRRAKLFGLQRDNFGTMYISPNEKLVKRLLEELNIEYDFQKRIDYSNNKFYITDFIIKNTNLILEAQGDYWHGNPLIYPNPSKTQLEKINNDKIRKQTLEKLGYKVIYLWEYDLINNYNQCKEIITKALPPI